MSAQRNYERPYAPMTAKEAFQWDKIGETPHDPYKSPEGTYWVTPWKQDMRRSRHVDSFWPPGQVIKANSTHLLVAFEQHQPLYMVPRASMRLMEEAPGRSEVKHLDHHIELDYIPGWGWINQPKLTYSKEQVMEDLPDFYEQLKFYKDTDPKKVQKVKGKAKKAKKAKKVADEKLL
jgi:hypothetical protein|tara:strand:- start:5387 stop:5917 length:531 start_codon:yes stop_codon:yes gene_type:complete